MIFVAELFCSVQKKTSLEKKKVFLITRVPDKIFLGQIFGYYVN